MKEIIILKWDLFIFIDSVRDEYTIVDGWSLLVSIDNTITLRPDLVDIMTIKVKEQELWCDQN